MIISESNYDRKWVHLSPKNGRLSERKHACLCTYVLENAPTHTVICDTVTR